MTTKAGSLCGYVNLFQWALIPTPISAMKAYFFALKQRDQGYKREFLLACCCTNRYKAIERLGGTNQKQY